MERDIINNRFAGHKKDIGKEKTDKMIRFAKMINEANQKFNITGLKSAGDILDELILGSIEPLCDIIVPRGTSFADLGSGAGIPGLALAVYFDDISGVLIESNTKKAKFIESVIDELELPGLEAVCERAEIAARNPAYREKFDWCFIRALGKLYMSIELGAPFVKEKGCFYIYSNILQGGIPEKTLVLAEKLGLDIMSHKNRMEINISDAGLCFKKERTTPDKYPRKFAVIKREANIIND